MRAEKILDRVLNVIGLQRIPKATAPSETYSATYNFNGMDVRKVFEELDRRRDGGDGLLRYG